VGQFDCGSRWGYGQKPKNPEQRERAMFEGINRNRDITIAVGVVVIIVLIVLYATNMLPGI
jgi:hypothetical protein